MARESSGRPIRPTMTHRPTTALPTADELPTIRQRTAPASGRFSKWLRSLAGVSEDILDWVPEERPRYAMLGAIILNTGALAGLSFIVVLSDLAQGQWFLLLPFGIMWGYLVMTFDRWLIASTNGVPQWSRIRVFGPRLAISVLLGIAIAEPLVLWVFRAPVQVEIEEYRRAQIGQYESSLYECNPITGAPPAGRDCENLRVNIAGSPEAVQQQLTRAMDQLRQSTTNIDEINRQLDELERLARDECAGTPGPGLTGRAGEGSACLRNRQLADQYRLDIRIDKQYADLIAQQNRIDDLNRQLGQAQQISGAEIAAAISEKVSEKRETLRGSGILDQIDALDRLTADTPTVGIATWVLRLLLIMIDSLPVLSKLMSGTTTYDRLVTRRLASANRQHSRHIQLDERAHAVDMEIGTQVVEQELRRSTDDLMETDHAERARRKATLHAHMGEFAAELERKYRR
ncbi:DUF4407 domain-containing protein [Nocardia sp. NPDC050710]|uniref:DUF4407 domain-containing protein n=1 Tax=Nocardia sp. NPDC050710 TaxID=3157220 RepID=UPI0033F16D5B